ncbi:MAG: hypothetical protein AABW50_04395 [Nanoarchaeota archaeon]
MVKSLNGSFVFSTNVHERKIYDIVVNTSRDQNDRIVANYHFRIRVDMSSGNGIYEIGYVFADGLGRSKIKNKIRKHIASNIKYNRF